MALVAHTHEHGGCSFPVTGQATHAAGESLGHIKNPEGVPIIIKKCICYGKTNSDGAANLTVGSGATVLAAHDSATIAAAAALAACEGTAWSGYATGDAGDALVVVGADDYIVACGSADTTGFTGRVYLEYVRAA